MLRRFLALLLINCVCLTTASEIQAAKLRVNFDLAAMSYKLFAPTKEAANFGIFTSAYTTTHFIRCVLFLGPVGIGTAIWEGHDFLDVKSGTITRADTAFHWSISQAEFSSHFPVIIDYIPYSKRLGFGNLSIHGYLKYCLFTSGHYYVSSEYIGEYCEEFTSHGYFHYYYRVVKHHSSSLDIGVSVSLNPLKFAPLWLRLGIQRLDYAYHIPESFKKAKVPVPNPVETRFYVSYGLSIGYWGIR